jgi:hypothetical protein
MGTGLILIPSMCDLHRMWAVEPLFYNHQNTQRNIIASFVLIFMFLGSRGAKEDS